MSVLDRSALEASPLADLHAIASELGLDSYRRLRKADLVDAILARQGGEEAPVPDADDGDVVDEAAAVIAAEPEPEPEDEDEDEDEDGRAAAPPRRRRGGRGGRGRAAGRDEEDRPARRGRGAAGRDEDDRPARDQAAAPAEGVEGVLEVLPNGSGFIRVEPPEQSDGDVYISAAQIRRCELVSGDRVSGPARPPRRSERHPSLVRVETINGVPADEAAPGRFDDLAATFPDERFELGKDDATLHLIDRAAPIGRGSRVTIVGPARSGKSETLRALAAALAALEGVETHLALAGVRPEEVAGWAAGPLEPAATTTLTDSPEAHAHAVERALEGARRAAARGGAAVLLVDTLEGLHAPAARKVLAAARNVPDGGSLTVIATAAKPLRRRDDGHRARPRPRGGAALPGPRRGGERHVAPRAAGRREGRQGDRQGARRRREGEVGPALSGARRRRGPRRARARARSARRRDPAGCSGTSRGPRPTRRRARPPSPAGRARRSGR